MYLRGGFLSYNRESSITGTTFNCNPNLWQGLKTPLLFASMGCNFYHDKTRLSPCLQKETKNKFLHLLESFLANPKIHIFLRNDGSLNCIKEEFGEKYSKEIQEILDNGFFYLQESQNDFLKDTKFLAINAISKECQDTTQWQSYLKNLTQIIEYAIETLDLHICFIPHIPQDLEVICEILTYQRERYKRENISVAPLLQGNEGAKFIGSIYQNSEFALVNRFHASILSFVTHAKIIGLPHSYINRMQALYQSVGLEDCLVEAKGEFQENVIAILSNYPRKKAIYQESQKQTLAIYKNFFEKNF